MDRKCFNDAENIFLFCPNNHHNDFRMIEIHFKDSPLHIKLNLGKFPYFTPWFGLLRAVLFGDRKCFDDGENIFSSVQIIIKMILEWLESISKILHCTLTYSLFHIKLIFVKWPLFYPLIWVIKDCLVTGSASMMLKIFSTLSK